MTYAQMKEILAQIENPVEKLEMLMDFGANMAPVPDTAVCYDIVGCASQAEICINGTHFYGRATSAIVRGVLAIITAMVDGKSTDAIRKMDIVGEFQSLNLNLGAGRLNGVNSMVRFLHNL